MFSYWYIWNLIIWIINNYFTELFLYNATLILFLTMEVKKVKKNTALKQLYHKNPDLLNLCLLVD